jgi:hypothetical protein
MKFTKIFIAAAATAMLAAAPVAAQDEDNGLGNNAGVIAVGFALAVFAAFILFNGSNNDQPVSP